MAFNLGSAVAYIKADLSQFKQGIAEAKSTLGSVKDTIGSVNDSLSGFRNTAHIAALAAVASFGLFAKASLDVKNDLDKAIISLDIIATRFGFSGKKAQELAVTLGKDLRIGTGAASDAMQNLIKSGLNLDQASDLLRRFTNEAMTGKSSSIDLATAVQNLSFAYATGNSALGNMSGISENWSDITEKGIGILGKWNGKANEQAGITPQLAEQIKKYEGELKKQGKTLDKSSDEQGKYIGLLALTNLTMGSSERFQGTYTDNVSKMQLKITDLKVALGTLMQNALNPLVLWFTNSGIIENTEKWVRSLYFLAGIFTNLANGQIDNAREALFNFIQFFVPDDDKAEALAKQLDGFLLTVQSVVNWIGENKDTVIKFFTSFGAALATLLIISEIIALVTLLLNPLTWVILGLTALFMAYQTNFMGIKDIVDGVVTWLVGFFGDYVIPYFTYVYNWWKDNWNATAMVFRGAWLLIQGIVQLFVGIVGTAIKVFLALMHGDFKGAWKAIQDGWGLMWEGVKKIFEGAINMLAGFAGTILHWLVSPFEDAWKKINETMGKIRDALDFTKRHSPSVIDLINRGVSLANNAFDKLEMPTIPSIVQDVSQGIRMAQVTLNLDGALIANDAAALEIGELIGDSIIKKLQMTIRT